MTSYTNEELAQGFEFKILRAHTNAFRKPQVLREALQQEALAGWTLVEKFDDARLRFKRPADAKRNDASLPMDPYRSVYGIGQGGIVAIILGCVLAVAAMAVGVAMAVR